MADATKQAEHTPGPWGWNHDNNWLEAPDPTFPDRDDYGHIVMEAASAEMMPSKADARLIAAAPELLGAAEDALEYIREQNTTGEPGDEERYHYMSEAEEALRAAITKAKGDTDG